ncbi:MAG: ABC transporter ATP-binding protein [Leptospiraceae bacterium]|nr:ABC transporter ATP-binding protein [Leptospiraceae bacterium]MDW7976885.1 ABC transporter ATP-binding protein [Leptospiraceae bacterium]
MAFLSIQNLHTYYVTKKRLFTPKLTIYALKDFSLNVQKGEFIAIVGESGCGKTTLGNTLVGLLTPTKGKVIYHGQEILSPQTNLLKRNLDLRKKFQMIFQDPYSSLNPKHTIKTYLSSALKIHQKKEIDESLKYYLSLVHLPLDILKRYPHELSGGQRQRVSIARAISLQPEVLVCDEITSALDVSVQAYILELLKELQEKFNLTIFLITHDLSIVRYISTKVCVMYGGEIMEIAPTKELFSNPKHPYTKALLESVPTLNRKRKPKLLEGEPPKTNQIYNYCIFYDRCSIRKDLCRTQKPNMIENNNHQVKCFFSN